MKLRLNFCLSTCLFFAATFSAFSQVSITKKLDWKTGTLASPSGLVFSTATFDGADFDQKRPSLPIFQHVFEVSGFGDLSVEMTRETWEPMPDGFIRPEDAAFLTERPEFETRVSQAAKTWLGAVAFSPIRKNGTSLERLVDFEIRAFFSPKNLPATARGPWATSSVLADGEVYKIAISEAGIQELTFDFLKNELKVAGLETADPRTFKLFSNGGGPLPEPIDKARIDDLREIAIVIEGETDGKMDAADRVLFYHEGAAKMMFDPNSASTQLNQPVHYYDEKAYVFLKISAGMGLRAAEKANLTTTPVATITEFDDLIWHEKERINLLDYSQTGQGAGRRWFGEQYKIARTEDFSDAFVFQNLVTPQVVRARMVFAARSSASSKVRLTVGSKSAEATLGDVNVASAEDSFATEIGLGLTENVTETGFLVKLDYPSTSAESEGFLDFLAIQALRKLKMTGQQMAFRSIKATTSQTAIFKIEGATAAGFEVWDVTDATQVARQKGENDGAGIAFSTETGTALREFVVFEKGKTMRKPTAIGKIESQNLHAIGETDMLILYAKETELAAKRLAEHRRSFSKLRVETVEIGQVFNEFSGGAVDPVGIREFTRMCFERNSAGSFQHLLLFGDGSFDTRGIRNKTNSEALPNINLIPVWETLQSLNPIEGFPADDFFALLSPEDGKNVANELLDIGVGRIPAQTAEQADAVVDKIIEYDSDPATLGDWRLRQIFAADDEDGNQHIDQTDKLAEQLAKEFKYYNLEKIYLDAYQQNSTAGDDRYPDAQRDINANVFRGGLTLNWIGHGGPKGWAQERVTTPEDLANWENPSHYPLLITATCSFGGYDDPDATVGGETVLLKAKSGAIGLFTTTRAVYISSNNALTNAINDTIFGKTQGLDQPIGLIMSRAKNRSFTQSNARRFALLGDPAMTLAIPDDRVFVTKINGKAVVSSQKDTIQSLQPVVLEGEVRSPDGQLLSDFNGTVSITIFDKKLRVKTLVNDDKSQVKEFDVQKNVIFKGRASVKNGLWKTSFIVPKDINYSYGVGKISLYAENGTMRDAAGWGDNLVIGGTFKDAVNDDQPPRVDVFMNNDDFVFGGLTDRSPKLFAKISDDKGINVTGSSVGHDLTAVLDAETANAIILNDFFTAEVDNSARGTTLYPLQKLEPGRHSITVKAWDIANNSGEGRTEFVVAEDGSAALDHVLNYPNPFTTNTFFQFEHNLAGELLDVQVQIFSISGKLVKTLAAQITPDGYRVAEGLAWDGRDDYGDQLAKGVYVYKITAQTTGSARRKAESDFERLVILK